MFSNISLDNILHSSIISGTDYLLSEQQADGSFASLSSEDPHFKNAKTINTTFFTSLILSALLETAPTVDISNCTQKAASFLLSQKSNHWSWNYWLRSSVEEKRFPYPDDLDDTFCALTALFQFDKALIDGDVFAKIVMLLTTTEKKEGGPYTTWLVNKSASSEWRDIDVAVNSNIAYFLSRNNIILPNLQSFFDQQIMKGHIQSPYYTSIYSSIYFISRFYNGPHTERLRKILLSQRDEKGIWKNPLDTALAVSALLNLRTSPEEVTQSITYLLRNQHNGHWKAFPFVNERIKKTTVQFGGSHALTTVFCIEALKKYVTALQSSSQRHAKMIKPDDEKERIFTLVMQQVEKRFNIFDTLLQHETKMLIDMIITKDATKQVPLLPYYFTSCLIKESQTAIPRSLLVKLGAANVFGWIAYTVFDDFLDEEAADPKILSLATLALRELTVLFSTVLPKQAGFQTHFNSIMDEIDIANTWEMTHCRMRNTKIALEHIVIPNFTDYNIIAQKSLGHCLGPLAILYSLGYKTDSYEVKHLISFFTHFLIAKQLNDDAHDWEKDVRIGQINPVSARILEQAQITDSRLGKKMLVSTLPELQEYFWLYTVEEICQIIFDQISQAKKSLHAMTFIENPSFLESFLVPIERATNKAFTERKNMLKFINTYKIG